MSGTMTTTAATRTTQPVRAGASRLLDVRLSDLGWLAVFNLLVFQMALQDVVPALSYIDEGATLLLLAAAVVRCVRERRASSLTAGERRAATCAFLFVAVTLVGNAAAGVQTGWKPVLIDLFTCLKFTIALLSGLVVFRNNERASGIIQAEARIFVLVCFVCAVPSVFLGGALSSSDVRYGLYSFQFVYGHPTCVNAAMVACLCLLTADCRRNRIWIDLALVVMALTLRSKGIGAAAFIFLLAQTVGRGRKMSKAYLLLVAIVVAYLGWSQVVYYYTGDGFARPELTRAGIQIANDYFPLGTGFATFGSAITADIQYYSPLYYEYGLSSIQGLALGATHFLSDTFWPILFGQGGYLGTALFVAAVAIVALEKLRGGACSMPAACCFVYLFISSTSESAFFHPMSVCIAFCVGLALSRGSLDHRAQMPMDVGHDWRR